MHPADLSPYLIITQGNLTHLNLGGRKGFEASVRDLNVFAGEKEGGKED